MVWSGPHAGLILRQKCGIQVWLSQISRTESSIQEICSVSRMDAIGLFECIGNPSWEESANFIILDTKLMTSAEGMKATKGAEAMGV